jgi:hypothetical protein
VKNPNAAVAAGGTSLSVFVVWLLGHFHVSLSAEDGAVIAGAVASVVLFVGRNGIKGLWAKIWNGGEKGALDLIELVILVTLALVIALVIKAY